MSDEEWIKHSIEAVRRFVDGCGNMGDAADISFLRGRITLGDLRGVLKAIDHSNSTRTD